MEDSWRDGATYIPHVIRSLTYRKHNLVKLKANKELVSNHGAQSHQSDWILTAMPELVSVAHYPSTMAKVPQVCALRLQTIPEVNLGSAGRPRRTINQLRPVSSELH